MNFILVYYYQNAKGNPRVYFNGFFYRLNTKQGTKIHWSCDKRQVLKCRAALTIRADFPYRANLSKAEHNHDIDAYSKVETFTRMTDISKIYENYPSTTRKLKNC